MALRVLQNRILGCTGLRSGGRKLCGACGQKDGVLPDNDSSCHPRARGYIWKHSYTLSSEGHDSMLMGSRPEARQGHPEDTLPWQGPRAPARGSWS